MDTFVGYEDVDKVLARGKDPLHGGAAHRPAGGRARGPEGATAPRSTTSPARRPTTSPSAPWARERTQDQRVRGLQGRRARRRQDRRGGLQAGSTSPTSSRSSGRTGARSRRPGRAGSPALITLNDIRGDLHAHTKEPTAATPSKRWPRPPRSGDTNTWPITNHSKRVTMARGLDVKRLASDREIDRLNGKLQEDRHPEERRTGHPRGRLARPARRDPQGARPHRLRRPLPLQPVPEEADGADHPGHGQPVLYHPRPSHRTSDQRARAPTRWTWRSSWRPPRSGAASWN